jgi:hypothetical protein
MPERVARADAKRSVVCSAVEHVFAGQKHRMGLVVRTIGIARARIKIGMANLAYNFQRLAWLQGRNAPAGWRAALSGPSSSPITQETYQITQPTLAPSRLAPLLRQNLRFFEVSSCRHWALGPDRSNGHALPSFRRSLIIADRPPNP